MGKSVTLHWCRHLKKKIKLVWLCLAFCTDRLLAKRTHRNANYRYANMVIHWNTLINLIGISPLKPCLQVSQMTSTIQRTVLNWSFTGTISGMIATVMLHLTTFARNRVRWLNQPHQEDIIHFCVVRYFLEVQIILVLLVLYNNTCDMF